VSAQHEIVLRGALDPSEAGQHFELAFEVPSGTRRIDVAYVYSQRAPADPRDQTGNTLDIGLADPHEFRGWSGSNKLEFTVAETWATPSYLAGPLPARACATNARQHGAPAEGAGGRAGLAAGRPALPHRALGRRRLAGRDAG
jgi:hypothetical protein